MKNFIKRLFSNKHNDLVSRINSLEYDIHRLQESLEQLDRRCVELEEHTSNWDYELEDLIKDIVDSNFDPVTCFTFEELEGRVQEIRDEIDQSRYVPVSLLPEYVYEIIVENYETIERKLKAKKDQQ